MILKHKIKYYVTPIFIISVVFIIYQIIIFTQLSNADKVQRNEDVIVFGTHKRQEAFYIPSSDGKFTCIQSMEQIEYKQINDDYCDCLDGTDEPGTTACSNGKFYCITQVNNNKFKNNIPTYKINDGICDCCDGSDEWKQKKVKLRLNDKTHLIEEYKLICPNICLNA